MSTTISTSFTSVSNGQALSIKHMDSCDVVISGTFVATIQLQRSRTGGQSWEVVQSFTTTQTTLNFVNIDPAQSPALFRLVCSAFTSGTAVTTLADGTLTPVGFPIIYSNDGEELFRLAEDGLYVKNMFISGTSGSGFANGTVSLPSITFASDADTGFYRKGANNVAVACGGVLVGEWSGSTASDPVTSFYARNDTGVLQGTWLFYQSTAGDAGTARMDILARNGGNAYIQFRESGSSNVFAYGCNTGGANLDWRSASPVGTLLARLSIAGIYSSTALAQFRLNVASTATIAALASTNSFVKLTGSTATDLQGITAGIDGQILRIWNATGQTLTIRNASASAASGNKITTCTGADITTTGNGFAEFQYDTDASPAVWVCTFASA